MPTSELRLPAFAAAELASLGAARPVLWTRPAPTREDSRQDLQYAPEVSPQKIEAARARMQRFAPLLARLFPELRAAGGRIESALLAAPRLQQALGFPPDSGQLFIKCDHSLPVAGSVKARGGFHEVLEFAESLALRHGLLRADEDYAALAEDAARKLFSGHRVAVGSTGNLGMAIGIMAAALGFEAMVHMSAEAKAWKKARLRAHGAQVLEHVGDYAQAVAAGREQAARDAQAHFVDDESSVSLMLGYALAGQELKAQLDAAGIAVDAQHPLFVYLPCGVGGAPTGIGVGIKQALGPHAHCFFAEPTQAPCFLLSLLQGHAASIYGIGLSNRTEADGLAVPRASELALKVMQPLLSGAYTVPDDSLFQALCLAHESEGLRLEPSAAAGLLGPLALMDSAAGKAWLAATQLQQQLPRATHVAWTTGGLHVPEDEFAGFCARGRIQDE